ncbi:hypothetical protein HDU79_008534 [Rhizoclosmatium sp. JEL0117]|nr:hypothetical protein HDU79_008534 [Rhizoclosmatium sp. JEL0117]
MNRSTKRNAAAAKPRTPFESIDHYIDLYISSLGKDLEALKLLKQELRKAPTSATQDVFAHCSQTLIDIHLTQTDSVSRFFALELIVYLFARSHVFRSIVVGELPVILQRTVGIQGYIIPGPPQYAQKCKDLTLKSITEWYKQFGKYHRQIEIARFHLRKLGFYAQAAAETVQSRQEAMRQERVKRERHDAYVEAMKEVEGKQTEIEENLARMKRLFGILIKSDNIFESSDVGSSSSFSGTLNRTATHKEMIQEYGLGTTSYTLEIEVPRDPMELADPENEENKVLYDELRECQRLQERYLEFIQKWTRVVSLEEIESPSTVSATLKRLLDLKAALETVNSKADTLITNSHRGNDLEDDGFDDEEFEEIPIPEAAPAFLSQSLGGSSSSSSSNPPPQRDESSATIAHSSSTSSSSKAPPRERVVLPAGSSIQDLLKVAPVVDFNQDLYYWDKKNVPFNTTGIDFHHRFLGDGKGENMIPESIMEDLRKRTVVVEVEHEEITACGARMKNGKLCPRKDKAKCPFHGIKVPRDAYGDPLDPNHDQPVGKGKGKAVALWEELEADVNQAVGESSVPKKRGPAKTALQEELQLLKKKDNVRTRMEKALKKLKK